MSIVRYRMQCPKQNRSRLSSIAVAIVLVTGCATWGPSGSKLPDVKPERLKRSKESAARIRDQRDRGEFQAAQFAFQQGDIDGARELLERVLKRDPHHLEAGMLLAELMILEQQPDQASAQLKQILARHPQHPGALHAMGSLLEAEGKPQEALAYFHEASRLAPDNQEYKLSCQTSGQRAVANSALPDELPAATAPRTAAAKLESSRRISPEASIRATEPEMATAETRGSEVRLISTGGKPSSSEGSPAAPPKDEHNFREPVNEAQQLIDDGAKALAADSRQNARDCFLRARRAAPKDPKIPIRTGVLALKHDELELAIEIAEDGIRAFPESSGLFRILGTAQYRLGQLDAAKASFEQSLSLDKSNPLAYFLLGSTLKKLGQTEAAERNFRQARQLDPRYPARL